MSEPAPRRNSSLYRRNNPSTTIKKSLSTQSENGTTSAGATNGYPLKSPSPTPSTVKKLRLSKALAIPEGTTVSDACRGMAARRVDVVLLIDSNALLSGIVTDKDIATRVLAEELRPDQTIISKVMTRNPTFVSSDSLAIDALRKMVEVIQFSMEMAGGGEIPNMPKSYSLNMFKDFVPMCIFSEANQGKVATEGKVEHKFDMKPHNKNMEEYRKMCRERTNKSMVKNRQIQVIDNDCGMHMRPMPGMIGLISSNSKEKKKAAAPVKEPEVKRTRRDRGELEDIMFKLFERQPNWALKKLVIETDQPAVYCGELEDIF